MSNYWRKRAKHFNELQWANDPLYLEALTRAGKFSKGDFVLDLGSGTGSIAQAIAPLVKRVIALDKSVDMLAGGSWPKNVRIMQWNILEPIFLDSLFDKIIARNVFHHILRNTQRAMDECHRVLKRGGIMVLAEYVPPSLEAKGNFIEIFKLKEKRLTFMENDLVNLMSRAGFKNLQLDTVWVKGVSVRKWLANAGDLSESRQEEIFRLINDCNCFKEASHLVEIGDDCLIDMRMVILTEEKGGV